MAARRQWRLGAFAGGAAWAGISSGISILVPFSVFVLFARALEPVDFGRFALAVVLVELVKALGVPGLYEAMLQRREGNERDQSTALGVFLLAGLLLMPVHAGLVLGLFKLTGSWPPEGQFWLMLLTALKIPVDLVLLQPQAELARRQAYARLAQRNIVANLGSAAVGLSVLALGYPLSGFLVYTLGLSAATALATIIGTRALRRPCWDPKLLAPLWREALMASGVRGGATANNQFDQFLVGALLGPVAFAHYNLGKRIETAFLNVSNTFSSTLLQPYFASTSQERRADAIRKALVLITATVGVGTASFVASADLVVASLLGAAWLPAVPAAILLTLGGQVRAITSVHTSLLSVSGRNGFLLKYFIVSTSASMVLVALAAPFGATMAATALLARILVSGIGLMITTRRDAGTSPFRLHVTHALLPFLAMLGAAMAARILVVGMPWASPDTSLERSAAAIITAGLAAGVIGLALLAWQKLPPRPVAAVQA